MTLVGAGYRPELPGIFHGADPAAECAELVADRYFGDGGFARAWELRRLDGTPTLVHGLCGNIASLHGPDAAYLEQIRRLADAIGAIAYSDHLALTNVPGRALGHLAPNLFDDRLLAAAADNIAAVAAATGRRVRLENLATTTMITGSAYTPEEFYLALLDASDQWDCMLDLTNVWINSCNRPLDPVAFVDAIPPGRIGYVHLAGGERVHGELVDTHSQAVHGEVFELLDHVLRSAAPQAVVIERDSNWSGAEDELRADMARVHSILASRGDHPPDVDHGGRQRRSYATPGGHSHAAADQQSDAPALHALGAPGGS